MSSYIAVELDVLNAAPNAARAAGVSEDTILGGLNRLWAYSFRAKRDELHELEVRGCFATAVDLLPTLRAFGWIADGADGRLRVRGADRYLRIAEARSRGGKTASANLKRGSIRPTPQPELTPGALPAPAGDQPESSPGSFPALTPNTEHRTPNTKEEEAAPPSPIDRAPLVFEPPDKPPDTWSGQDFFAWFQACRQTAGLVAERWPRANLSRWWSEVLMTPGMSVPRLQVAVKRFGASQHWRDRGLPFAGFMAQWRDCVPALEAA